MSDLTSLRERIEKASGPDRELDALIWAETEGRDVRIAYGEVIAKSRANGDDVRLGFVDPTPTRSNFYGWDGPAYTSDLNAALGLVEAKLPGRDWDVGRFEDGTRYAASVAGELRYTESTPYGPAEAYREPVVAHAPTPALALLSALLAALSEQRT